ncbi:MAG TPA: ribosome maturation factor RimM [Gemmatimonadaceae bacterium]
MTSLPPDLVIVGRVRKAHGIRGDLVVEPISDAPDAIFASGRRVFAGNAAGDPAKDGKTLTIRTVSPFKGGYIVHFDGIEDRTVADTWRERYLLLPHDELEPLADDEVYVHELPDMRVVLTTGEDIGIVDCTYELPQGLTLDVKRTSNGQSVLIPFDRIVKSIDRAEKLITIDPPAGLLE